MKPFPKSAYNLITLGGVALALFALAAMGLLYLMDNLAHGSNPYLGAVLFFVLPAVLIVGLLLIPLGMWRQRRRGSREPLVVDLGLATHRNALLLFAVGTAVFLFLTTLGMYGGYEYMESNSFCGEVCHAIMEPEYVTHQAGFHSQVHCVDCHIRPGADWYMKAKINGARQLVEAVRGTYSKPIPTPIEHLPPDEVVCVQCHRAEAGASHRVRERAYFLGNADNTPWHITLVTWINGGGGAPSEGAHWHRNQKMTFVVSDAKRLQVDQVTWETDAGPKIYTRSGTPMSPDSLLARQADHKEVTMGCLDCHNRPAHRFLSPVEAVNAALESGNLDASIPWIKREAVLALSGEYDAKETAGDSLEARLQLAFEAYGLTADSHAVSQVRDIYQANNFPGMDVRWDRYPEHQGHLEWPGCFRCHGSQLRTAEGETISADCNLCHAILDQGIPDIESPEWTTLEGTNFRHPVDVRDPNLRLQCVECHSGGGALYSLGKTPRAQSTTSGY